jgi:hypothetical protein
MKKITKTILSIVLLTVSVNCFSQNEKRLSFKIAKSNTTLFGDYENINNPLIGNSGIIIEAQRNFLSNKITLGLGINHQLFSNNVNSVSTFDELYLNFKTNVTGINLNAYYSPTKQQSDLSPFLNIGISLFHFNPKTDARDYLGDYTFSNGELMNTNGENTALDGVYETNLSEFNLNNQTYRKTSFGIPIGLGLNLKISSSITFVSQLTYQINFSDFIDNIPSNTTRNNVLSNSTNDHFLGVIFGFTFAPSQFKLFNPEENSNGISYDEVLDQLIISKSDVTNGNIGLESFANHYQIVKIVNDSNLIHFSYNESLYNEIDFDELDKELDSDLDGDGVPDMNDMCPNTPKSPNNSQTIKNLVFGEVKVDVRGCPIDTDNDGVPDYRDIEPNTKVGYLVNHEGKRLSTKEAEKLIIKIDVVDRNYANKYNKLTPINLEFEENYYPYITPQVYDDILKLQQEILMYQVRDDFDNNINSFELLSLKRDSTINYLEKIKTLETEYLRITTELKALKNILTQSNSKINLPKIEKVKFEEIDATGSNTDHYQVYVHRIIQLIKLQSSIKKQIE